VREKVSWKQPKQIVNVRLTQEQRNRIRDRVESSTLLDESKFIRLALEFAFRHRLGDMIAVVEGKAYEG